MKKESSDLVAIAGHLWRSDQQNYDTGKLYHFKKIGVNETASSETVFKIGHLGKFERPFDLPNQ